MYALYLVVYEVNFYISNPPGLPPRKIKSGIENPSESEVIGRCGGDEKTE